MKDKKPAPTPEDAAESALEQRVDAMLDVNLPDPATAEPTIAPKTKPAKAGKTVKVVSLDDSETNTTEAAADTDRKSPEPSESAPSEPPSAPPVKQAAKKKNKSIAIIHADEAQAATVQPEPEEAVAPETAGSVLSADAAAESAQPVDDLTQTIKQINQQISTGQPTAPLVESAPPVPPVKSKKTLAVVDTTNSEPPVTEAPGETPPEVAEAVSDEPGLDLRDKLDEPQTDKAVDEIIAEEADELLAVQDDVAAAENEVARETFGQKMRRILGSARFRWAVIIILLGLAGAAGAWPQSRYAALNAVGVRAEASLRVTDQSTFQPLRNVEVKLGGQIKQTDEDGKVTFSKLRLGLSELSVSKKAFAPQNGSVTVGWGSNPLGERALQPAGVQYAFVVKDFLSGKPVGAASVTAGQSDAAADDTGKIRLTLEHSDAQTTNVTVNAPGYRSETVVLDLASKLEIAIKMVPAQKSVFVSNRSGKYDVYKIDIDGKNETLLLAGTGSEREDIALAVDPANETVAVVSTRDNKRNADGYLMSTLTLIGINDGSKRTITQSEQVNLVGWSDNKLVYVQIAAGASSGNPNRQRLMTYDYKQNNNKQLASTNYFNDVLVAGQYIYYAPSSTYQTASVPSNLFRINADGSNKQTILGVETWNIVRSAYDTLLFSVPNEWYDYKLGGLAAKKLSSAPASTVSRIYVDSPDKKQSLWIDQRDGKGTLLVYNVDAKAEKTLLSKSNLVYPSHWLNNKVIVYRVSGSQETADYAVSIDGGEPVKIKDVSNTGGVDKWYYY